MNEFLNDYSKFYSLNNQSDENLLIEHHMTKSKLYIPPINKKYLYSQIQKKDLRRRIHSLTRDLHSTKKKFELNGYFRGEVEYEDSIVIFSKERLEEALNLIYFIYEHLITQKVYLPFPSVLPVSDGSYDIEIESEKIGILINIPKNKSEKIDVYGETYDVDHVEFKLLDKSIDSLGNVLLEWIEQNY